MKVKEFIEVLKSMNQEQNVVLDLPHIGKVELEIEDLHQTDGDYMRLYEGKRYKNGKHLLIV